MSDVTLIAILLAFFALAIGLVRVLGRMIEGDGDPGEFPDEASDAGTPSDPSGRPSVFVGLVARGHDADPRPDRGTNSGLRTVFLAQVSREAWSATLRPALGEAIGYRS